MLLHYRRLSWESWLYLSVPTSDQRLYDGYPPVLARRASGLLQAVSVSGAGRTENFVLKESYHREELADLTCYTVSLVRVNACKNLFQLMKFLSYQLRYVNFASIDQYGAVSICLPIQ